MKTMTKKHTEIALIESLLATLSLPQMIKMMNFLSRKITEKTDSMSTKFEDEDITEEPEVQESNIPDPKPIWWDYPISPKVMAMRPKQRILISDTYKEELYEALEEKYK
ncbi:MAG: hypothetical protein II956_11785 [Bacteroidales bacterium]|nr:hypothetical protein [Bacteroidales bacterium]